MAALQMLELQKQRTGIEAPLIHLSTDQVRHARSRDFARLSRCRYSDRASQQPKKNPDGSVPNPQVYDGGKAFWKESDPCDPVNTYGLTKLEAERAIQVCLRSPVGPPLSFPL